ncbi:hypothetical protein KC337_g18676 [Hortaea werneckii]|nr:hypothetical protein KC337_g18676 [Hortaea werneckii]
MATHSAVDIPLSAPDQIQPGDQKTPTTPRPQLLQHETKPSSDHTLPATPSSHDFGGVPGQRALPEEPVTPLQPQPRSQEPEGSRKRDSMHRAGRMTEEQDVDMAEGDDENAAEDDGSDNESVTSDSQRPSKKKKGQRFFCTEFPPCNLSFTRNGFLAWITCDSMRRPYMLMKTYPVIRWRRRARDSKGKSGQTEYGRPIDRELPP